MQRVAGPMATDARSPGAITGYSAQKTTGEHPPQLDVAEILGYAPPGELVVHVQTVPELDKSRPLDAFQIERGPEERVGTFVGRLLQEGGQLWVVLTISLERQSLATHSK